MTIPARKALTDVRSRRLARSSSEGQCRALCSGMYVYAQAIFTPLKMLSRKGGVSRGGVGPPPPLGVVGAAGCGNIAGPLAAAAGGVEGVTPGSARYDSNVPRMRASLVVISFLACRCAAARALYVGSGAPDEFVAVFHCCITLSQKCSFWVVVLKPVLEGSVCAKLIDVHSFSFGDCIREVRFIGCRSRRLKAFHFVL
jgi:hypothetical protein